MPKIQLHPNLAKLKEVLESGHNLIDHFLVCGIPPNSCLQDFLYDTKNPKYEEIFKENIKPSIISRFPEFDNSIDSVDEGIVSYCFPDGFKPIYSNNYYMETKTKFFTIILDNNLFSIEHPQKYLSCLLFYENLNSYSDLKKKLEEKKDFFDDIEEVEEIETENNIDNNNKDINDNVIIKEKYSEKINDNNNETENSQGKKTKNLFKTILFKGQSEPLSLNIINKDKDKTKVLKSLKKLNSSVQIGASNALRRSTKISEKETFFYIPKVICLVSIHPYIKTFEKILRSIYSYYSDIDEEKKIPLEKLIISLIIEVPISPRGLYSIHYEFLKNKYIFKGYENNKILVTENNLINFNSRINFKTKLEVFKHILFCSKLLFFSTDLNILSETILSFLVLLYPFKYPFQASSLVHKDTYDILGCFTPFMFGINEPYNENFMEENDINTDDMNILMVDLDNIEKYKLISDEEFPNLPSKLTSNLEKEIKNLENKYKKENANNTLEEFNELYQNIFFEFFCEILKGYEDYLNMDYFKVSKTDQVTSTKTLFQCSKFIKMHSSSETAFYDKFVDVSQLFGDFIYKRMIPRNNQEVIDVLLVNETNIKLKNKSKYFGQKEPTDFLDSKEYFPSNKYIVPAPRKLTMEEYDAIEEKKDQLLSYGQEIKYSDNKIIRSNSIKNSKNVNNNNNKENKENYNNEYNEIIFNYLLFPQLDFQTYCNANNVNDYYPPPDYSEEIEAINSDLLSKSSIGQSINLGLEMKNNLYLTWIEVWSYTFWYLDKEEREYRFDQVLDILDKVIHHEINIFNLMFDVLNQQGEQEMIIKLYQKMLLLKINPNTNIYNIISNILDNEQIKQLFDKIKSGNNNDNNLSSLKFNKPIPKLKVRTFLNMDDKPYLINEKLKFEAKFSCIDCGEEGEEINLYKLCQDFEGIKNDVLWAPCKLGHYNLPKLKISFGTEYCPLNVLKPQNNSTSTLSDIVLHSPYNLKINIKNAMKNKYGTKLDVDKFKSDFCALFWNFIWYCKIYKLDYSIVLPYLERIKQKRMNKMIYNHNLNNIKLIYDNNNYKYIEAKLKEIETGFIRKESDYVCDNKFQNLEKERPIWFQYNKKTLGAKNKQFLKGLVESIIKQPKNK